MTFLSLIRTRTLLFKHAHLEHIYIPVRNILIYDYTCSDLRFPAREVTFLPYENYKKNHGFLLHVVLSYRVNNVEGANYFCESVHLHATSRNGVD
jgi:hypothetical protein